VAYVKWLSISCVGAPIVFGLLHRTWVSIHLWTRGLKFGHLLVKFLIGIFYDLGFMFQIMITAGAPVILGAFIGSEVLGWLRNRKRRIVYVLGALLLWQLPCSFVLAQGGPPSALWLVALTACVGTLLPVGIDRRLWPE